MRYSTIFFGTHEFAATILQALIDDPKIIVDLVVTQPDKPVGRKQELQKPPIKILAEKHNLTVIQPESLKNFQTANHIFHIGVTAQYGKIIPQSVLDLPKHGILNVHTSLLPKYRGASPIQSALINGETETGVTIMKMEAGLDTGPILIQQKISIDPDDTYLNLDHKLAPIGAKALLEALPAYIEGTLQPQAQDETKATHCKQLSRDDGQIDWQKTTAELYNLYRGLTPWPGIWTTWNEKRLKLLTIRPSTKQIPPGKVMAENKHLFIGTADSSIEVLQLQLEGKSAMDPATFLSGYQQFSKLTLK